MTPGAPPPDEDGFAGNPLTTAAVPARRGDEDGYVVVKPPGKGDRSPGERFSA